MNTTLQTGAFKMIKFSKAMYSPMLWSKRYAQNICNALPEVAQIDKSINNILDNTIQERIWTIPWQIYKDS